MKKLVLILLLFAVYCSAQNTLPYSSGNICLDNSVTITPSTIYPTRNIVVKDFNNDNYDDIVLMDSASKALVVYRNNAGNLSFQALQIYSRPISRFHSLTAGDYDADGDQDIAICFNDTIKIFNNTGNLTFTEAYNFDYDPGVFYPAFPTYIRSGHLNADGNEDIALLIPKIGSTGLNVLAIRSVPMGAGIFSLVTEYTASIAGPAMSGKDSINVSIGNFDGNNSTTNDIIISNKRLTNLLHVARNNTSGAGPLTFTMAVINSAVLTPGNPTINISKAEAVDVNNDGISDVIALSRVNTAGITLQGFAYFDGVIGSATLSTFNLPSNPTTYQLISIASGTTNVMLVPDDFVMADINGDGKKDFVGINSNVLIIYKYDPSNQAQPFSGANSLTIALPSPPFTAEEITVGNYDNNGLPDIYFKPWRKIGGGKAGVLPNFSYLLKTANLDTVLCPGKTAIATLSVLPSASLTPNHSVDWYEYNLGYISTGPTVTINAPGRYYPNLNLTFPVSSQTCVIKFAGADTIRIVGKPAPSIFVTPSSPKACPGGTLNLSASSNANPVTFTWVASQNNTVSTTSGFVTPPIIFPTPYTVFAKDQEGCVGAQTLMVNLHPLPSFTLNNTTQYVCPGGQATLSPSSFDPLTYIWTAGNNTIAAGPSFVTPPTYSYSPYLVIGYDAGTGCAATQTFAIDTTSNATPRALSSSKNPLCAKDSADMTVSPAAASYTWSAPGMTVTNTSGVLNVKPPVTTQFTVNFVDFGGCTGSAVSTLSVDAKCEIKIYNSITMNGDLSNDKWHIDNIENYPGNTVHIFNRWGTKIFSTENYNNNSNFWPEKDGKNLEPSTYYYVLDLGNGTEKIKGWIELIR